LGYRLVRRSRFRDRFPEHDDRYAVHFIDVAQSFPSAQLLAYFAKLRSMRGKCVVWVQLQNEAGEVVWQSASVESPPMETPLQTLEVKLRIIPVFPAPGDYDLVLVADGEELEREEFKARLLVPTEPPDERH